MTTKTETDIIVKPTLGFTPEQAHDTRARAWAFVFECYEEKKAGVSSADGDDAKGTESDRAKEIMSK